MLNAWRIPTFILRGILCAAADNWILVRELHDARARLKAMR